MDMFGIQHWTAKACRLLPVNGAIKLPARVEDS